MNQLRKYAVVKYAWSDERPVIHVHHLLKSYHWVALDDKHVFLTATYGPMHHGALDSHPDVLLLPSLQIPLAVSTHAADRKKQHLFVPLKHHLGLDETHAAHHIVTQMVKRHGVRFEPEV